jgi:hypothetical protein
LPCRRLARRDSADDGEFGLQSGSERTFPGLRHMFA